MSEGGFYRQGTVVAWCPTCRRPCGKPLGRIDFKRRLCRCGLTWNRKGEKRLRNWCCGRKIRHASLSEAQEVADMLRMGKFVRVSAYPCPFDPSHFHVGKPLDLD